MEVVPLIGGDKKSHQTCWKCEMHLEFDHSIPAEKFSLFLAVRCSGNAEPHHWNRPLQCFKRNAWHPWPNCSHSRSFSVLQIQLKSCWNNSYGRTSPEDWCIKLSLRLITSISSLYLAGLQTMHADFWNLDLHSIPLHPRNFLVNMRSRKALFASLLAQLSRAKQYERKGADQTNSKSEMKNGKIGGTLKFWVSNDSK